MPTPYESATLNLRLYELRREPVWVVLPYRLEVE